jgi:ubiquitin carboxyl-terminal hydrolase L5
MDEWCTIESDPGVFTEILHRIGVTQVLFEEILSLNDEPFLDSLGKIHGLIFLFNHSSQPTLNSASAAALPDEEHVYFARQEIPNACASQAILSLLFNSEISLVPEISDFRDFAMNLDLESRGLALGNLEKLKNAHNAFRAKSSLQIASDAGDAGPQADAFHFVAYVKTIAGVFELDGLKEGPLRLAEAATGASWVTTVVLPHIRRRVAAFPEGEIRFNLLALIDDPATPESAQKKRKWQAENARRMHDFTPAVIAVLKRLAATGKLDEVLRKVEAAEAAAEEA